MNDFIAKNKLISPKTKYDDEYKAHIQNFQQQSTETAKSGNNCYFSIISNRFNNIDNDFSKPFHIYDSMSKMGSPVESFCEFNVKDTLYPDMVGLSMKKRYKTVLKTPKSPEYSSPKPPHHEKNKTHTDIYSSINISITNKNEKDYEIPFLKKKNKLFLTKPMNSSRPTEKIGDIKVSKSQIFSSKAYIPNKINNILNTTNSTLINTFLKRLNTTNDIGFIPMFLNESNFNKNNSENDGNNKKRRIFKNILQNKSLSLMKYGSPLNTRPDVYSPYKSFRYFL